MLAPVALKENGKSTSELHEYGGIYQERLHNERLSNKRLQQLASIH